MKVILGSVMVGVMLGACGGGSEPVTDSTATAIDEKGRPKPLEPMAYFANPGLACDFLLRVEGVEGEKIEGVTADKRSFTAGTSQALTFTKYEADPNTGDQVPVKTMSFGSKGAVSQVVNNQNPDGSYSFTYTGTNFFRFSDYDVPPSGSATVYIGRVVFNYYPATYHWVLQSHSGQAIDICAALK